MKKYYTISFLLFLEAKISWACDACKKQQPKITQDLTHGTGPTSDWDWVIVGIMSLLTLLTLIYSLKFLIKPGEEKENHIKNFILNN